MVQLDLVLRTMMRLFLLVAAVLLAAWSSVYLVTGDDHTLHNHTLHNQKDTSADDTDRHTDTQSDDPDTVVQDVSDLDGSQTDPQADSQTDSWTDSQTDSQTDSWTADSQKDSQTDSWTADSQTDSRTTDSQTDSQTADSRLELPFPLDGSGEEEEEEKRKEERREEEKREEERREEWVNQTLVSRGSGLGGRCPDVFRCTDEASYWLQENEDRKRQVEDLRETISELQEELRSHRHRVKVLELQGEERRDVNSSVDQRFRGLQGRYSEADMLLQAHGSLLFELQLQIRNLTDTAQSVSRNPGCSLNIIRTAPPLLRTQEALHPEGQRVRSVCPIDCASLYHVGVRRSGVYTVLLGHTPVQVYCDMHTEGGGWTVFQRRQDGKVNFNRGWHDYRGGFGDLRAEHWLGLDALHRLTAQGAYSLRIHLQDWSLTHRHALYQSFSIEGEKGQYRLHVSDFSGSAQDSFAWYHDQQPFSTPGSGNLCADLAHAGWWFRHCFHCNLNGVYYKGGLPPPGLADGLVWWSWRQSDYYSLRQVAMMVRPRAFRPRPSP